MKDSSRLKNVQSYKILDTPPEKDLDEITELASLICQTPISLITILDDKRQWFKSNKGLAQNETAIEDSFCQYAIDSPDEIMIVNDALEDSRFNNSSLVLNDPNVRFYAGVPLVTDNKNVLGTLCVLDKQPKEITKEQQNALKILARRAMTSIELRKTIYAQTTSIKLNTKRLFKITENIPIGLYELQIDNDGKLAFLFLSKGMEKIHPGIQLDEWIADANIGFLLMHPDDIQPLKARLSNSIENNENLYFEYRVKHGSGYHWHAMTGKPEKNENGETILYGSFTDVTNHYKYEATLEKISFDISHVLRQPVTSMLGITHLIESEQDLSSQKLKEYSRHIKTIAEELEHFTRNLNDLYHEKKEEIIRQNNKFKSGIDGGITNLN